MGYLLAYNPYNTNLFLKRSGMDPAAIAYFNATGITAVTQQQAINTLVKSLKSNNIWSKMKAVYPFVTDNRNLFSYTENLNNSSWNKSGATVIANNAIAPDGSNTAWRITRINSAVQGFTIRQDVPVVSSTQYTFSVYLKAPNTSTTIQVDLGDGTATPTVTLTTDWQLYTFVKTLGFSGAFFDFNITSGDGSYCWFWHPQLELGSTATTYQPIATTQQAFISSQFKFNLVNPVDSDAAFRLVFNGGWTHSANGATPNGTNGYANTFLTPSIELVQDSVSFGYYTRDISASPTAEVADMGSSKADVTNGLFFIGRFNSNSLNYSRVSSSFTDTFNVSAIPGLYYVSRIASNQYKTYRNATVLNTSLVNSTGLSPNPMWIGGINYASSFSYGTGQCAFSYIGAGLNDTEAANLYTAVQAFQTALSRQV